MESIHIALGAEQITELFGVPITNTLLTSWIVMGVLVVFAYFVGKSAKLKPGRLQTAIESLFTLAYDYIEEVLENKTLAKRVFPLLMTVFLFIFFANFLEFIPGVGSIGFFEVSSGEEGFTPLFRSVNTDFNTPFALAVIAFITIEVIGVATLGALKYASKFLNFKSVIGFIVGIIELLSEIVRLISFSFRLFGNIFAGEVLILIATAFIPFIFPVPFMMFEVFIGFIQAAIFSLLTLFFIKIAIAEPH